MHLAERRRIMDRCRRFGGTEMGQGRNRQGRITQRGKYRDMDGKGQEGDGKGWRIGRAGRVERDRENSREDR